MIAWVALGAYLLIAVAFGAHFAWSMWGGEDGRAELRRLNWNMRIYLVVFQCFIAGFLWPLGMVIKLLLFIPPVRRWTSRRVDNYMAEQRGETAILPKSPRWWSYVATRLSHLQPLVLLLTVSTGLAADLTSYKTAFTSASNLLSLLVVVSIAAESHHERRLCPYCVAATPLDGSGAANKRSHWLNFHHWSSRVYWLPLTMWLIAFTVTLTLHTGNYAYYVLFLYWATQTTANLRHRPVVPWCPQCRRWGWGDGEGDRSPAPVPTGQGHK